MIRWLVILANGYFVYLCIGSAVRTMSENHLEATAIAIQFTALLALNVILLLAPGNPKK